ncbi:MAG: hypothetical protein MRY32_09820 [Rickettsiales bacterium]|nr:hypothetical protein [Rickettsiales bacterium]
MISGHLLANISSVTGAILILGAYGLLSAEKLTSTDMRYHLMNLFGAIFIMMSLLHYWNLGTFVIEVAWIGVSLYGIYKASRSKSH